MTKIAAIQLCATPDLAHNLARAAELIKEAVNQSAKLVLLPEYFCLLGRSEQDKFTIAEHFGEGPIQAWMADQARQHKIILAAGSMPLLTSDPNKVTNTLLVFDETGSHIARYDKVHLFSFQDGEKSLDEGRTMCAGNQVVSAVSSLGRLGLSICYDLRFPELYRAMGTIDILLMPAAFTVPTGRAHWEVLLRARAIENQCYVLAAGQHGGHPNGRDTYGHSMLIDPWGEILDVLPAGEGVVLGEYDLNHLTQTRHRLQALSHKRVASPNLII